MNTIPVRFCRRLWLATLFLGLAATAPAQTVTISFDAGQLSDASGNVIADGALVLLLGDTLQNGFGFLSSGSLTISSYLSGDNQILALATVGAAEGTAGLGLVSGATAPISLAAGSFPQLTTGDPVALVWFPTLTGSSTSLLAGVPYGLFTDPTWTVPASGQTINLEFFTVSAGGTYPNSQGYASLSAIPEPSTYAAIAGAAALAAAAWRRRNRKRVAAEVTRPDRKV